MRVPVTLPECGEPAIFSAWFVSVGDNVRAGERIAEVLIPGVAIDVLAPASGTLVETCVASRQTVNEILGWLEKPHEPEA